jgi:hypothetical protein
MAGKVEVSGFIIVKSCMNNQLYATTPCRAMETSYPLRQLIGQAASVGDSFVAYL